ncbi:MAG: hypothetical protein JXB42_10330 [Deltaproteobacteria bacterium]|nr:hypothetical protein [Deltaproteobacteria bacterium]
MNELLNYINPLKYFTGDQYSLFWQNLFTTVLSGFWARMLVLLFLGLAVWFGIRREQIASGMAYFIMAIFIAYGAGILRLMGAIQ